MIDFECLHCGSVKLAPTDVCHVCAIEMEPARAPFTQPTLFVAPQPRPPGGYFTNTSIGPFDMIGSVLEPTVRLFANNFWLITKLVVVIVAPFEILNLLNAREIEEDWQFTSGIFLLRLMCQVLIAPALIFALMKVMQTGIAPGVGQCYRWGSGKLGKLFVVALITWILQGIGYALCFVPGILISLTFSLVYPLAVLEKGSPLDVLRDSQELTKGHRGKILGTAIVIGVIWGLVSLPAMAVAELFAANSDAFLPSLLAAILSDIMWQALTVLSLVTYLSIRCTLEGGHTQ